MPDPAICASIECEYASGEATVRLAIPLLLAAAITAVSAFSPLSMVTACPGLDPKALVTGIAVAPAAVAAATLANVYFWTRWTHFDAGIFGIKGTR